jgi:hypothetical protein
VCFAVAGSPRFACPAGELVTRVRQRRVPHCRVSKIHPPSSWGEQGGGRMAPLRMSEDGGGMGLSPEMEASLLAPFAELVDLDLEVTRP